jgi:hypothetical protein
VVTRKRPRAVTEFSDNGKDANEGHWHLNKGIPVVWIVGSLLIGLAQFAGFVWMLSQFNTRIDMVEKTIVLMAPQGERLTRLEEKMVAAQKTLDRIETLVSPTK